MKGGVHKGSLRASPMSCCDQAWRARVTLLVLFPLRKRAPYIAYLTRCRQGLQTTQAHLERLLQRVLRDKEVANRYFTTVCVRLLLESKEKKIREFIQGNSVEGVGCWSHVHGVPGASTSAGQRSRTV